MENSFHDLPGIFSNANEAELLNQSFRNKLIFAVKHLLESDLEKLVNILYRIDIEEDKVNRALASNGTEEAVSGIADLIIQRQIQKLEIRKKYSGK